MKTNFALFGGTFNPIHIGHLRIALEVIEALSLDYCELLPAFSHPQKNVHILPYEFRLELLNLAIADEPKFRINTIERELASPSYTINTLEALKKMEMQPYFIIGLQDFKQIHTWKNGLEIAKTSNLAIVNRANASLSEFQELIHTFYPKSKVIDNKAYIGQNLSCHYLELPTLDISSSQIRRLWLEKKNYRYLVTETCYNFLKANENILKKYW